jgi:hypothetical protein
VCRSLCRSLRWLQCWFPVLSIHSGHAIDHFSVPPSSARNTAGLPCMRPEAFFLPHSGVCSKVRRTSEHDADRVD